MTPYISQSQHHGIALGVYVKIFFFVSNFYLL